MVVGLETEKDLEHERTSRASVLSLFKFTLFSSIQVWMPERQVSRDQGLDVRETGFQRRYCRLNVRWKDGDLELSIIRKRLRLNSDTKSSQRDFFLIFFFFYRGWRELGPTQNLAAHHRKSLRLVRRRYRRWLTVFYLSDKKKTRRVQYQRCHTCVGVCWEVCSGQLCQSDALHVMQHSCLH